MITVVIKENDLATQFPLEAAGCDEFRKKKTSREKPAGLLSKGDYGSGAHSAGNS
jgi:hypothetical protein